VSGQYRTLCELNIWLPVSSQPYVVGIKRAMHHTTAGDYFPQLTIRAAALEQENAYRIVDSSVEFRIGTGSWRALPDDEIRRHFRLHTSVAVWLERESKNPWVWG
jgi:hypothetical protein